jgi:hypothetical protein
MARFARQGGGRRARAWGLARAEGSGLGPRHAACSSSRVPEKPKIDRYQQLVAWQSADALADHAESMVSSGPAKDDPEFCKQIRKSTAKAPAQIAEGFVRFIAKESAYYYRIARASLAETQNH